MEGLLKVRYGVQANLPKEREDDTLYFVTDTRQIYKGHDEYTGDISGIAITKADQQNVNDYMTITFYYKNGTTESLNINVLNNYALTNIIEVLNSYGTEEEKGLVKLSDKYSLAENEELENVPDVNDGIAATPKAVVSALENAKAYTNEQIAASFAANDAMVFKGTIGIEADGATDTDLPTAGYSAGWTYKVVTAGTYAGYACEVGDMIIAINDGQEVNNTVSSADWTVVQSNIDGAVTAGSTLTANQIILGNGSKTIKTLASSPDDNNKVLTIVNGEPAWTELPEGSDTTYTFEDGTDGSFSVTPLGGSTQTVYIGKPAEAGTADKVANTLSVSISSSNLIGTTAKTFDGSSAVSIGFGEAAAKDVSTTVENNANKVITAAAVYDALLWKSFSE